MSILWTIVIGFVVGLIARFIKPGSDDMGFVMTTLLGIGGALVASFAGQTLGWYAPGRPAGFIASLVGAVVLLVLIGALRRR